MPFRRSKIFTVFFFSFSVMLLLPTVVLVFIYWNMADRLEKEIYIHNYGVLEQCSVSAEDVFNFAGRLIQNYCFNIDVQEFLKEPVSYHGSPNFIKVRKATQLISDYDKFLKSNGILEIMFYAKNSDCVVSSSALYAYFQHYQNILTYKEDRDLLEKQLRSYSQKGWQLPELDITLYQREYRVISLFQPVYINYSVSNMGYVAAFLDTERFHSFFSQLNLGDTGLAYIAEEDGSIIIQMSNPDSPRYSNTSEINFDAKDFIFINLERSDSGRIYSAYIPKQAVYSQIDYLKKMIFIMVILEIIFGVTAAVWLSYKNAKPIMDIFGLLANKDEIVIQDYNYLRGTISNLVSGNELLSDQLEQQKPIIRADFIRRFVGGSLSSIAPIDEMAERLGFDLNGKQYSLMAVKNLVAGDGLDKDELSELDNVNLLIGQIFQSTAGFRAYSFQDNERELVFLLVFTGSDYSENEELVQRFVDSAEKILGNNLNIPLGYVFSGYTQQLDEVPDLYISMKRIFRIEDYLERGKIIHINDLLINSTIYYPIEHEQKLIGAVLTGNRDRVSAALDSIYRENFVNRRLSDVDYSMLHHWLYLTILRLIYSVPDAVVVEEAELLNMAGSGQKDCLSNPFKTLFLEITDRVAQTSRKKQEEKNTDILNFMQENLTNSTFSLYDAASCFNYTESSFYKMFKKNYGCTFSTMLERLRLERACVLLEKSEISIEEIASTVGYNSGHAFRRAFTKYMGVLPSDFRREK